MSNVEKRLIEAAAEIHTVSPSYASAFLDGVKSAINAMSAEREEAAEDEDAEGNKH